MDCGTFDTELDAYFDRRLSPAQEFEMDSHKHGCEACRERFKIFLWGNIVSQNSFNRPLPKKPPLTSLQLADLTAHCSKEKLADLVPWCTGSILILTATQPGVADDILRHNMVCTVFARRMRPSKMPADWQRGTIRVWFTDDLETKDYVDVSWNRLHGKTTKAMIMEQGPADHTIELFKRHPFQRAA